MKLPKGFRNNINIVQGKIGPEKRQELLDNIANQGTFLPRGVMEEDMDQSFIDFVNQKDGLNISINGKKVPVFFLTIQRWSEFSKTWQFTDENRNVDMPFITVVRKPDIQQGNNQAGLWNIAGGRTYTYMKIPTFDGERKGIDLYKIPQPTSVDITYEVRLFTNRMRDLNKLNRKIQRVFQSRQHYINVNGHPMPLYLENIGDESNIDDFENKRFYVSLFEVKLEGYILDEEEFEVIPTINRVITTLEIEEVRILNQVIFEPYKRGHELTWTFVWKPNSQATFNFNAQYDSQITQLTAIENITRITIWVNGGVVFDGTTLNIPINITANDSIQIKVYKSALTLGRFILIGNTTS